MPAYTAQIPLLQNRLPLLCFFRVPINSADGFHNLRCRLKDVRVIATPATDVFTTR